MSLESWGRYPKVKNTVFRIAKEGMLKPVIEQVIPLISYGNGKSYGDSALGDTIVHMRAQDYFIDFDAQSGLLHVQSGVLLAEILDSFVPRGWFLKVTPGTKLITVGGAIASDVHGKNHHIEGCFSECVKEFEILLADGEVLICSRETMAELFRATCGGMGLTGVIVSAKIYLKKIKSQFIDQTTIKSESLQETFAAFEEYKHASYSVAWIDCLAKGDQLGKSLLMVGDFSDDGQLAYQHQNKRSIPFDFPSIALNNWSVRCFNWLYYKQVKQRVTTQKVGIDAFFYPLDAIAHWNRIYGKNGFIQYQFILPKANSYAGLEAVLSAISASGKGSFLAVLKLYGKANENYLSFPMEGYSLALDFKIEKGTFALLEKLDKIVVQYKGRIYLAKDARVSKEIFEQGYPQIDRFRQFRKAHKMNKKFQSLQSKRVGI